MTADFDALSVTINYDGGSITLPIGNAKDLFGEDSTLIRQEPTDVTVSKKAHSRVRLIGGATTQVSATTYTYKQFPRRRKSQSAAGEEIVMAWEGSEGGWVARMNGPAWMLSDFLNNSSPKAVTFTTAGSHYGPFIKGSDT